MTNKELSIGSILNQQDLGQIVVAKIFQDFVYANTANGEPIEISEKYLLDFGFTKIEEKIEDCTEFNYELETPHVYFNYSVDWSLAIADSKDTFDGSCHYLVIPKELTNKIHLWQQLFKSLTGKDKYENQSIENY